MNKRKLLEKIQNGSKNLRYSDFVTLIEAFGFEHIRAKGSHEIFKREGVADTINIQNRNGYAKSYQVKQFLSTIEQYNLKLEDDEG